MSMTVETDLKEILGEIKQEFAHLNRRLDKIDEDLTKLKISQAEIKGDLNTLKTEQTFIREDVKELRSTYRNQIWALIITIMGAIIATVIKFGFLPNP
jgi:archaellum component FlaC